MFVTALALVCTNATLVTHIQFEENGKGIAKDYTWTKKNEGVRGERKEAH